MNYMSLLIYLVRKQVNLSLERYIFCDKQPNFKLLYLSF